MNEVVEQPTTNNQGAAPVEVADAANASDHVINALKERIAILEAACLIVLPEKQPKANKGETYSREVTQSYQIRFGLSDKDMQIRAVKFLVKGKTDGDVYITQLRKKIAMLEAKVAALLAFVGKYSHLKSRKVAHAPEKNA
jgi:hypothetical protein